MLEAKQGQIFKKSTIYFKINLYKFVTKYLILKKSMLSFHCFKNNFKLIKTAFKENVNVLRFEDL